MKLARAIKRTGKRGKGRKGRDAAWGALNCNTYTDENFKMNNLKKMQIKKPPRSSCSPVWLSRCHDDRKASWAVRWKHKEEQ